MMRSSRLRCGLSRKRIFWRTGVGSDIAGQYPALLGGLLLPGLGLDRERLTLEGREVTTATSAVGPFSVLSLGQQGQLHSELIGAL